MNVASKIFLYYLLILVAGRLLLEETKNELSTAIKSYDTPKDWLIFLEQYLSAPEKILAVSLVSLRLDWRNVLTEDPDEKASTMTFAQCSLGEEVMRDAVFIAYTKEKME